MSHLVLHPELDESSGHEDGGPAQASHAVDPDAGVGLGEELLHIGDNGDIMLMLSDDVHLVHQAQPLVHDVLGGGGAVSEAQL